MNDRRTEKPLTVARITMLWMGNLFLTIFLVSVVLLGIWFISRLIHDGVKDSFASLWAARACCLLGWHHYGLYHVSPAGSQNENSGASVWYDPDSSFGCIGYDY